MFEPAELEALSRRQVVREAAEINSTARRYLKLRRQIEMSAAALTRFLEIHATVAKTPLKVVTDYAMHLAALACAYGIDLVIFGPLAQYAATLLGVSDSLAQAAEWLMPGCFIGVEVYVCSRCERARQDEYFAFASGVGRVGWTLLGALVAVVMPIAAFLSADSATIVSGNKAPGPIFILLGIVSFAAHVVVLFGGRTAQDAKAYFGFVAAHGLHKRRLARTRNLAEGKLREVNALFIKYAHMWRLHNQRYPKLPSGPFDQEVVQLLQGQFPHVTAVQTTRTGLEES